MSRAAEFDHRVARWRPDLVAALGRLYDDPEGVAERLLDIARAAYDARPDGLHDLDDRRLAEPDWFQRSHVLGYAAYADRFGGTLEGVGEHVGYLTGLGVTYLHLMPLLTPRPDPNDGGYAVADYRTVRSDLGDVDELRDLATVLREQGISLCIDLVLNHTAREHAWAEAARAGDAEKRDYYLVFPDRDLPDRYEQSLPEVFPDFAPGSFTFDDDLAAWVWTTFNDYQWDLNWANPSVLCEFADILLGWANVGVEVFRLDAIAFLWKRMGTSCQNQPEVHDLTQALRTVARIAAPAVLFKAEAIVGPADLPAYLGTGAHAGKVSDLAYHNSLMVQVWSMLASGEVGLAAIALQNLPQPPSTTSWITYLRCHDDIGWAIDDTDAWRAGLNGFAAPAVPRRLVRRRPPRLVGPGPGVPGELRDRRPTDQRVAGVARRTRVPRPWRRRADPARARGGPELRWPAGDLDGRRGRPAQRPGLGRRTHPCRRQPLGAPAADALAGAGRHRRHQRWTGPPAPRPRRGCHSCTPPTRQRSGTHATPASCSSYAARPTARCSPPPT